MPFASSKGPWTPEGDVTRIYTYHVPDGTVTETDAALDERLVLCIDVKDATLVMPEVAPRYTVTLADATEAPLVLIVIVAGIAST